MTQDTGKKKINILFVLPNFDTGGSEKLAFDIIRNIDTSKFSPVLCVFFTGKLEEELSRLGVPFYVVHRNGVKPKWQAAGFISGIVRRHKIEVVNTHHTSPLLQGLIPFKMLNRVRWIHTEHLRLDQDPNVTPKYRFLTKICLKFVDRFVGISQGVCDYFREELGVPERKIVKILNGIDLERFTNIDHRKERIEKRKKLGIDEQDVVIGMFANFRKQKNHGGLIRAFALIKEKIDDRGEKIEKPVRLLLAGSGPELESIKALCRSLDLDFFDLSQDRISSMIYPPFSIFFLGARTDIPELMNAIDIYCLPSHFEGLPFSLIEAFAAGKRVVATDVSGNRDVVGEMGWGMLVEPDDPQALAKALHKMIGKGAGVAEQRHSMMTAQDFPFSFEGMMRKYEQVFSE